MYYESQCSSDRTVLNTAVVIYLKFSNIYNSTIIDVDYCVAYQLLAAIQAMSMSIIKN